MARLTLLHYPDPRLRKPALPVEVVDERVRSFVDDMLETMYAAPGIGLAATQVNIQKRIIVMDVSEDKNQPLIFINPTLLAREGESEMEEGCLSVPGFYERVQRAERVWASALDRHGDPFELDASGLLAVCIQHEIDHLDGKLFVDYLSALKRDRIRKKLEKQARSETHAS
ncbi:MAG: peptide deformylase [Candidatus Competibacteraceae bacterium]|uniref:Peptide deformylase n=1 Tax=Candidatus Contendobacter odensis Run_B_J11 TaxID=1400861 RepID=A0A7U7GDS4_9GAMM|nr:peptide deformylase [Candidatus Contendobacter odensis]MBK8535002.1 peptide deformylase [Candidatus Competibacteraceae bacterium]MBK8753356.1 peptide deformylase [Candidatus Competibacteraceae bacterium]CDH46540.1 peptide deformylase [Candidatus Contendobacter odensis Run_B_J11]